MAAWLLIGLSPGLYNALPATDAPLSEYQVKAAFLLNFTKFIEWPEAAFADARAPFVICILGEDPFGRALDRMLEGETVNNHRLAVQRIRRYSPGTCQVLFVNRGERDIAATLSHAGPGVLTVGEGESFLRDGGMIAFVIENRRVRFDINLPIATNAALKISSKLLNVARMVGK